MPSFEANMVKKEDLVDHLQAQLGMLKMNEAERRVAMLIIFNLDDDGYLKLPDVEGDPLIRLSNEGDVPMQRGGADAAAHPEPGSEGLRRSGLAGVPAHPGPGAEGEARPDAGA